MIEGAVDLVSTDRVVGWLSDKNSDEKFGVVAMLNGLIIGESTANHFRPDLAEVGFGDGFCGFEIGYHVAISESDLPFVTVCPRDSQLVIPRNSTESYSDAFHALVQKFPHAGRSRTIFGGLWTDRTDAHYVLAGRVKARSCPEQAHATMRSLIVDGHAEFALGESASLPALVQTGFQPTATEAELKTAVKAVGDLFISKEVATFLKLVFDDLPVMYKPQVVSDAVEPFAQAVHYEALTSPAEMLVAYVLVDGHGARLDYVVESHELPEFSSNGGVSRWTADHAPELPVMVSWAQRPVHTVSLEPGVLSIVGPGLIHRLTVPADAVVLRVVCSPRRVTPLRFLGKDAEWVEVVLPEGVRACI